MLEKKRKHFINARTGGNIFTDIVSKIAASPVTKSIGEAALKGATKGVKLGAEEGSKQMIKKIADKLESRPVQRITPNKDSSVDASTRKLLDSLKLGNGINHFDKQLPQGSGIKVIQ